MATILKGKPVADAINEKTRQMVQECLQKGIEPTLAILRVGEREDDLSYERGAMKRAEAVSVSVKNVILPADVEEEQLFGTIRKLNDDPKVHGILMFRPLPKYIDGEKARNMLHPKKDVDGCTDGSLSGVFTNTDTGFAPCTAQAAVEILKYYWIEISGKRTVVMGRSLVIGRPVAMLLMHENATITICHRKTKDMPGIARNAEILVSAIGEMENIGREYLSPNQVVIDVGIGWNEEKQKLCGDVCFEEAEGIVQAITPVPGGVGSVTTSILMQHTVLAAMALSNGQH